MGCKHEGRARSVLFGEEPDCVSGSQLQPERTTFPRHYWGNAPLSPEVGLLPQGQAPLLSLVGHLCLFVELHHQELLMLITNYSYELK